MTQDNDPDNRNASPEHSPEGTDALLRRHGLRLTAQRVAVLRALAERPHSTTDEVHGAVRAELGAVSRQAVYDAVGAMTDRGILRRVQPAGSPARYERRVDDNHHHVICRICGRIVDVDCATGDTPCLTAIDDSGFEIDEAEVLYWGRCRVCATGSAGSDAGNAVDAVNAVDAGEPEPTAE